MAGPHEIALGVASILGKPGLPNPLLISFRGQTLDSAAEIIEALVSETGDAGIGIEKIELDPELELQMELRGYTGRVRLMGCDELISEIRVFAT
jgi:hypothetical protein